MRTKEQILSEIRQLKSNPAHYSESVVRADPYSLVAQRMLEKLPHSVVFKDMSFKQVRSYCKDPIMTALYNSKEQPKLAFGEDTPELEAFYTTLYELFPGAMNVLEALNARWDNTALTHTWRTADNHIAHVRVLESIHGVLDNEGLNLPYNFYRNQPSKVGTSLAPNYVHGTGDAFIVRNTVTKADFQVAHVHDELQSHPNHMGKTRVLYLDGFRIISESELLEEFCEEDFGIDNTDFLAGLSSSSYALC